MEHDFLVTTIHYVEAFIKEDLKNYASYEQLPTYTVEPIWMTQEEYNNIPEINCDSYGKSDKLILAKPSRSGA